MAAEQARERDAPAAKFEPEAERRLREMSDFLAGQRQLTVRTQGTIEAVLESGQKIQFHREGLVSLRRPDRLRVDRTGDLSDLQLFYDGKQLTLYGEKSQTFAAAPAPPTLDDTLDMASDLLGLEPPAADLLYSNPYAVLRESMRSGTYLGRANVEGVATHHLAFQGDEVDVQIWIEDGPRPLPRKYVVTSKRVDQAPQYAVVLSDWDLAPQLSDSQFVFRPPAEAQRVSFLEKEARDDKGSREQSGSRTAPKE
ncbi:DUF2092 domain-containing protein [Myxococcus sp. RHSTA-1-4]|uniref:DUF2092 domain-containing protein n=1 Tax=Myxococcus sp. RHSTA-1-4 TaxID=2874601 RepID=UPI001CBAA2B4|nr:DUF2092 domain-containing protein [Myxococcus sp. RHSTA-1-4]MBZ4422881.1 DUF2092 domain-containing protein [Myxococcus sp. RHSTA-1-4]